MRTCYANGKKTLLNPEYIGKDHFVTIDGYWQSGTQYQRNFIYKGRELDKILFDGGYIQRSMRLGQPEYKYYFYIQDHLGSNRVVVREDGEVVQAADYLPSGISTTEYEGLTADNHLHTGKEFESMHGLHWYDNGARWLDPIFHRFTTMDPLAEKYYSISPYAVCLNNSLQFVDPTGMIVEDPDEIYIKHKEQIERQLFSIQDMLRANDLTDGMRKALGQLKSSYKSVLKEYSVLEKSNTVYRIFNSGGTEGGVFFDKGTVMIGIGESSLGLIGHELKHAFQYEKGEISFKLDGSGFGTLYDISDETAAYNRERMLNSGLLFFTNPETYKWNNSDVRTFGQKMLPPAYQNLPEGPISIHSKVGRMLRNTSIKSGMQKVFPSEVYNGYQKDYNKGLNKRK